MASSLRRGEGIPNWGGRGGTWKSMGGFRCVGFGFGQRSIYTHYTYMEGFGRWRGMRVEDADSHLEIPILIILVCWCLVGVPDGHPSVLWLWWWKLRQGYQDDRRGLN